MSLSKPPHRRIALIVLSLLAIILVALPFVMPFPESQPLDDGARGGTPGQYLRLSGGTTHYELAGPADGDPVVFVHGFSTPYFIWDHNFPAVVAAGYRALRYDLLGRGLSDRPTAVNYDADLFDRQLLDLLDGLKIDKPITLVGLSMGGAITVLFAERHPERVKNVVLIDPAGFPLPMPLSAKALQLPLVGEYLIRVVGPSAIRDGMASNFYNPALLDEFAAKFAPQMRYTGFFAGQLSTLRHMPLQTLSASYQALGKSGKPVLLVWGKQDVVIPFDIARQVTAAVPQATLLAVDPSGHVPNFERPEIVNPRLLEFLAAHREAAVPPALTLDPTK